MRRPIIEPRRRTDHAMRVVARRDGGQLLPQLLRTDDLSTSDDDRLQRLRVLRVAGRLVLCGLVEQAGGRLYGVEPVRCRDGLHRLHRLLASLFATIPAQQRHLCRTNNRNQGSRTTCSPSPAASAAHGRSRGPPFTNNHGRLAHLLWGQ